MRLTQEDLDRFVAEQRSESYRELCFYVLRDFVGRELSADEVGRYVRQKYGNPNSRNVALALFKSFAKWKRSKIPPVGDENNMARFELEQVAEIKRARVVREIERRALSLDELERVLKVYPPDSVEFSILYMLAYTGARPGELLAVTPEMVEGHVLNLVTEKTRVKRRNPLSPLALECMKRLLDVRPSYMRVYKTCVEAGEKAKLGFKLTPKVFRSTFRTLMDHRLAELGVGRLRGDIAIKLAQGHTVPGDMAAIYSDFKRDIEDMFRRHHFILPIEEKMVSLG
ncbi:MAG: hypothetical protein JRD89_04410 [Deltaproteobacteria bacterium]|nr:hypothetical protein [Deltaproteobacteria bacterium]